MASMTIRGIDDGVKTKLRLQAARHGCSMEEEVREILRSALDAQDASSGAAMFQRIRDIVEPLGGLDIELPPRDGAREPPDFR